MRYFPFERIRQGQRELINDVYFCVANKLHLLADAPTGIGKTSAVLAATLNYAMKNNMLILFLTPRHSQHRIVIETIKQINKLGHKIVAVDLIGKRHFCNQFVDDLTLSDFFEFCRRLKETNKCIFYNNTIKNGHFTRNAIKLVEKIKSTTLHAEEVKDLSKHFCPYEILLYVAKNANVIVGDYYHGFSFIRDQILKKVNRDLDEVIFIVDEAHNLPQRIREMCSTKLSTFIIQMAIKELRKYAEEIENNIGYTIEEELEHIHAILHEMYEKDRFVDKKEFVELIQTKYNYFSLGSMFLEVADIIRDIKRKSFVGSVGAFLDSWLGEDNGYTRIIRKEGKYISLYYNCLDCSKISKPLLNDIHSCIFMSGTLRPLNMYFDILGLPRDRGIAKTYSSPFPKENRLNIVIPDVTTKFTERNKQQFKKIAYYLNSCINCVDENIAVFFPSYELLNTILKLLKTEKNIFVEKKHMSKKEKSEIYKNFLRTKNNVLIGVQTGSFAEGIDYPGKTLSVVIIVGLNLEKPTLEIQALIDFYNNEFNKGWEYAYITPAVLRALQTAGRCIRSEKDRGVCIFMDKRFLWTNYRKIFTKDMEIIVTKEPEKYINEFFTNND